MYFRKDDRERRAAAELKRESHEIEKCHKQYGKEEDKQRRTSDSY
jgi:hypothetical protein